ncbi:uncharacterized protein LOC130645551 isoform X2 [Hydractinia symbiolongicarpus]|uniref:uncharacterized protein LOC130645551 isoform X2 n=1 Tax=Hydractinia symbiolongicarpus TaxID=13093 RepID=UPI002551743F|nr:uncharacterized protein LOC130645551 isoform X2 [Hydractinia symbiolongicarpus]
MATFFTQMILSVPCDASFHSFLTKDIRDDESAKNNCEEKPFDHNKHWLFEIQKDIAATVPSNTKSTRRKLPVECIRENFNSLINQLQIAQKTLPREKWSKPVTVDHTISINASVDYLFCNDTMRFRRKINLKNTAGIAQQSFCTDQLSKSYNSHETTKFPSIFSSRFPRRAKMKAQQTLEGLSDDEFETKQQHKKSGKIILIDARPQHPKLKLNTSKKKSHSSNVEGDCSEIDIHSKPTKKRRVDQQEESKPSTIFSKTKNILSGLFKHESKENATSKEVINIDDPESGDTIETKEEKEEEDRHPCPMCNILYPASEINEHAYQCQGPSITSRTRSSASQNSLLDYSGQDFDNHAWAKACEGLNETPNSKPDKTGYIVTLKDDKRNVCQNDATRNRNPSRFLNRPEKSDNAESHMTDYDEPVKRWKSKPKTYAGYYRRGSVNSNKTLMEKRSAVEESWVTDDDSDNDIYKGYVQKGAPKTKKTMYATSCRNFDESQDEHEGKVKCGRCAKYVPEEELKVHTDECFNNTTMDCDV